MKILDTAYMLNNSKKSIGCEMLHLGIRVKEKRNIPALFTLGNLSTRLFYDGDGDRK